MKPRLRTLLFSRGFRAGSLALVAVFAIAVGTALYGHSRGIYQPVGRSLATAGTAPLIFDVSEVAHPGEAINITGGTFDLDAIAWIAPVAGGGTVTTGSKQQMAIESQSDFLIQANVPGGFSQGLWAVWVENADGQASDYAFVNRAHVTVMDAAEIRPSGTLHLFGRNLIKPGGTYSTTSIFFVNGATRLNGTVTAGDNYQLTVTAPSGLVTGTVYDIYVTNGLGGSLGETRASTQITARAGGADPFSLGVEWAPDFAAAAGTTYNAKTDSHFAHAAGDGTTDDTAALQAAINYASTHGGGTVSLPAGTYLITGRLTLNSNAVVKGAGPSQTTVAYSYSTDDDHNGAFVVNGGASKVGILDMTLSAVNTTNFRGNAFGGSTFAQTNKVFVKNVTFDTKTALAIGYGLGQDILIENCTLNSPSQKSILGFGSDSRLIFRDNAVNFSFNRLKFMNSRDVIVTGNTFHRDASANVPFIQESGGLEINNNMRLAVDHNEISVVNGRADGSNDSELLLSQVSTSPMAYTGIVTASTASGISDSAQNWTSDAFNPYPGNPYPTLMVAIVDGPGRGQWRYITSHDTHSMTVDRPWDILPVAGSSKYVVTYWNQAESTITSNTIAHGKSGINASTGGWDIFAANNHLLDTGGIRLGAYDRYSDPSYVVNPTYPALKLLQLGWKMVAYDNVVEDASGDWPANLQVSHASWETNAYWDKSIRPLDILGAEMRNNTVIRQVGTTEHTELAPPEFYSTITVYVNLGGLYPAKITTPSIVGTILESNDNQHPGTNPYMFSTGLAQTVLHATDRPSGTFCGILGVGSGSAANRRGVSLRITKASTGAVVARGEDLKSGSDGKITLNDPTFIALLQSGQSYAYRWKIPGYLSKAATATYMSGQCIDPGANQAQFGDIDGDNAVGLTDVTSVISSFAGATGGNSSKVNTYLGAQAQLTDVTKAIGLFSSGATGD